MADEHQHEPGHGTDSDPKALYERFSPKQKEFAGLLVDGVYGLRDTLHQASRDYTADTSLRTYLQPEEQHVVIQYVAGTIDKDYVSHAKESDHSPEAALAGLELAYDRYNKLAHYKGHTLSGQDLERVYFQMRVFFHEAASIAIDTGNSGLLETWQKRWKSFSNGPEEEMANLDPDIDKREDVYQMFKLNPDSDETWEQASIEASWEDSSGEIFNDEVGSYVSDEVMDKISAQELIDLAKKVRSAKPEDRYGILAEASTLGMPWVDVIYSLKHSSLGNVFRRFTEVTIPHEDSKPEDSKRWNTVVEFGARDAKATDELSFVGEKRSLRGNFVKIGRPIADRFVVVEPNTELRNLAEQKLAGRNVEFLDNNITELPLEDGIVDLAIGDRLVSSLGAEKTTDFYKEVARVLSDGGIYIDGYAKKPDANRYNHVTNRWKNLLSQMIADLATGATDESTVLDPDEEAALFKELGLNVVNYGNSSNRGDELRALIKNGTTKDMGYIQVPGRGVQHLTKIVKN